MSPERIKLLYNDFKTALERLEEAVNENISSSKLVVDGTIQRFEFCFELAWKLLKQILRYNGINVNSPRMAIKEAYVNDIIQDAEDWIIMLEARNKMSHTYKEETAYEVYEEIKTKYYFLMNDFAKNVNDAFINGEL